MQANPNAARIEGPRGQFIQPDLAERVRRLEAALAVLATLHDTDDDLRSAEEVIERMLYPEHFR